MEKSKVAVVACPDYEPARVKESLQKGLEAIGGLESLIGKEENILLKPNLVRSAKRERAVVTDPEVMDALITILRENGYNESSHLTATLRGMFWGSVVTAIVPDLPSSSKLV